MWNNNRQSGKIRGDEGKRKGQNERQDNLLHVRNIAIEMKVII